MSIKKYISELKRRNVFKAGIAYLLVAWLIAQVASIVFPAFDAPPYLMKILFFILIMGFPIILVFSWVYDVTNKGIKKTKSDDQESQKAIVKNSRFNNVIIALLSISVIFLLFNQFWKTSSRNTKKVDSIETIKRMDAVEKSIAVLPFNSLSTDEENQHFADGLVEDLISRLSMVEEFKVISRTSSDTYRERGKIKVSKIAIELGVSYIVEGSIQKYDDKARVTIHLIDAKNDYDLWSRTFDIDLTDIFKIQSEIAMQIASDLSSELTEQQTIDIQKKRTGSVKAFELYQLGRFYWGKRLQKEYKTAIYYFEQAIAVDPNYALAYAGLGDTYFLKIWGSLNSDEIIRNRDKAEKYALKALDLDERLAEAYTVLATLYFFIDWDWAKAEKTFLQAIELNPNYSTLHHRYSEHLSTTGRHEEARKHINKALELDPLSYIVRLVSAKLYLNRGLFPEALAEIQISKEINKDSYTPLWYTIFIGYEQEDGPVTLDNLKMLQNIIGDFSSMSTLDSIYETSGIESLIRWKIDATDDLEDKAKLYVLLGENEKAMDWFELAFNEGNRLPDVPFCYSSHNLHSNRRFITLMKKMNLPWQPEYSP